MNTEAYLKYAIVLMVSLAITLLVIGYAHLKSKFSKKMDQLLMALFIINALLVVLLILKTWL